VKLEKQKRKCKDCVFFADMHVTKVCLLGSDVKRKVFKEVFGEWEACEKFISKREKEKAGEENYEVFG